MADRDLIDRSKLDWDSIRLDNFDDLLAAVLRVTTAPSVENEPVRCGHWEQYDIYICNSDGEPVAKTGVGYKCPFCGRELEHIAENYCPSCGAKLNLENK